MPTHMPASFTRHDFHKPNKKEREEHTQPHTITNGTFTVGQPS